MKKKESELDTEGTQSVAVSVTFTKDDVSLAARGPYTAVGMPAGMPSGEPGEPELPWKKFYVSVPWQAIPEALTVEEIQVVSIATDITVEPMQPNVPTLLGTRVESVGPNPDLYTSERIWPEVFARLTTVLRKGGFAAAEIEVCPFRYHLRAKQLDLIERVDLALTYKLTGQRFERTPAAAQLQYEQKMMQRFENMVLNPDDVRRHRNISAAVLTDLTPFPKIDYVIITTDVLAAKFQRLANWRNLLGLRSRIVTVEDIVADAVPDTGGTTFFKSDGYADGGTRDLAEAIRNFIKFTHESWLIDYALLGGDEKEVPCRQGFHTAVGEFHYGDLSAPLTGKNHNIGFDPVASSEKPTAPASNVLDDNESTFWECASSDSSPWIQFLVDGRPVNGLELSWGPNYATSYIVQASDDGTTWNDVYTTTAASGGAQQLIFSPLAAKYIRVRILSGTNFALGTARVYGPSNSGYGGVAYRMADTITRVYLSWGVTPNSNNDLSGDLILFLEGPSTGTIIPYNENANDTALGWRFVNDLLELPSAVSQGATSYLEICGPAQYHGNTFALKSSYLNYIPADLYYADVAANEYPQSIAHDWDKNPNRVYGERYGGELDAVEGVADLYVGRAPVKTEAEVDIFTNKIINYEKFVSEDVDGNAFLLPKDFAVSVLLGSQNWFIDKQGELDTSAQGKEDIRRMFLDFDASRWIFTRCYEDEKDVPPSDRTADLTAASTDAILNAIKDGCNVVSLTSHGSSDYLCYLVSSDIQKLTNPPAIFYGNACLTNEFDTPFGEALSEWAILNPHGAAVAYVGNSRFGWTSDNPIEKEFWGRMLYSIQGRLGEMFNACKLINPGWESYSSNLLGDPGMRVWSDRPKQISVNHVDEVCTGSQEFKVIVSPAVEHAIVTVTMGDALFATGETDAAGIATLSLTPMVEGALRVTVSGKNLIPYLGSVTVKKCQSRCIPAVICDRRLVCNFQLFCSTKITCEKTLMCIPELVCSPGLTCRQSIICTKMVNCQYALACGKNVVCTSGVHCIQLGGCATLLGGCTALRPEEFSVLWQIYELWGISNIDEFIRRVESPQIREAVEQLPLEIKRPIQMMLDRIKQEGARDLR